MKLKVFCLLGVVLALGLSSQVAFAEELAYYKVYKPYRGISLDELMKIKYHIKYTLFARDYQSTGNVIYIDKNNFIRKRKFDRRRIILGRASDGLKYKDFISFTYPTSVKGLATLTWTYLDPKREQEVWLWLPSLRKIRKVSASQRDDSFMGSDFTVEEVTTRKIEDETYKLLGEERFKGYTSDAEDIKGTHGTGISCYVVECRPTRENWYYSKRVGWIDRNTGAMIYEEIYDPLGKVYKTIYREYKVMKVGGQDYVTEAWREGKDLNTGHRTIIYMENIKFDQGLDEGFFSEKTLRRSKW